MLSNVSRRCFLKSTAAGVLSSSVLAGLAERLASATAAPALGPKSKVRIGKLYLGREHPGWPMATVDVNADMKCFEANLAKLSAGLADVEFIEGGLITTDQDQSAAIESQRFATRCLQELGFVPGKFGPRLSSFDLEFLPAVVSLYADAMDPLDP